MLTFSSLLSSGSSNWHTGNQSITYSFLSTDIPAYYSQTDVSQTNGGDGDDTTSDAYILGATEGGKSYLTGISASHALNAAQRAAADAAIQAWNEVANVGLTEGTAGSVGGNVSVDGNGTLVTGLGGAAGFGEHGNGTQSFEDFGPELVNTVFESGLNFYGTTYHELSVSGGRVGFDGYLQDFTSSPDQIHPVQDARDPGIFPFMSFLGSVRTDTGTQADKFYVDFDPIGDVITITWADVGFRTSSTTNPSSQRNSFQLQLFDRGNGDFDFVFRYQDVNWTTRIGYFGDADGDGLSSDAARAGWTAGDMSNYGEIPASGNSDALLALETTQGNTGVNGVWAYAVRGGQVIEVGSGASFGDITFGAYAARTVDGQENGDPTIGSAGQAASSPGGFASYPTTLGSVDAGGDIWLNSNSGTVGTPAAGNFGWQAISHELGHALGLTHPNNDPTGTANDDNNHQYTIMSYNPHPNYAAESGDPPASIDDYVYPVTPMLYDMQAIQNVYGANMSTRTEDTTYFGPGSNQAFSLADNGALIAGIWDAGGIDTFNLSNQTNAVYVNLKPGEFSSIGSIQNNIVIASGTQADGTDIPRAESAWIENVIGGSANDHLTGNLLGNILQGNGGNDTIDGAEGVDIARFTAAYDTYQVSRSGETISVTSSSSGEGRDTLANVERIEFSNGYLAFDLDGTAGQTFRLYRAAFDREPDQAGLSHNVTIMDGGLTIFQMANAFIQSDEFKQTYGENVDDTTFVTLLYQNVLNRGPDQAGLDGWRTQLASGQSDRSQVLFGFSESAENKEAVASLIDDGIWLA